MSHRKQGVFLRQERGEKHILSMNLYMLNSFFPF